jgi:LemA protein
MQRFRLFFLIVLAAMLSGCGYNTIQQQDEAVKAQWSEVLNQYQRRADLVPNLVATVKGFAAQEERVLTEVTNARSRVGQMNISADQASDPETLKKFQAAQGELSGALSRLLVVSENYPELKSNENFRDLQVQLEGTENRVTVARNRYIQSVQAYNTHIRQFPVNITAKLFGYQPKANFSVENEAAISKAPTVEFAPATPAPAPGG